MEDDKKLVKNGEPLTEWTCSCGFTQKLAVKSLLEIESQIDYYNYLLKVSIENNDVGLQKIFEAKIATLQWTIGWFDNIH